MHSMVVPPPVPLPCAIVGLLGHILLGCCTGRQVNCQEIHNFYSTPCVPVTWDAHESLLCSCSRIGLIGHSQPSLTLTLTLL